MLEGKKGVILGVANKRSLAWSIAQACQARGATLGLTYQNERFLGAAEKLAAKLHNPDGSEVPLLPCDVSDLEQVAALAASIRKCWGRVDFVVHSIAFAHPDEFKGDFRNISAPGFQQALDISCYSLIPLSKAMADLMPQGGAILALSYLGGERVVPGYNLMGVAKAALDSTVRYLAYDLGRQDIRVNAIAPGPIKTVSAAAVGDFGRMLDHVERVAPLCRNVTGAEVGDVAAFLVSDMARALTGAHIPIDCGYSIMGSVALPKDRPADKA